MISGVYDCSPSELLSGGEYEGWYEIEEIRRRISFDQFKNIRYELTSCLGPDFDMRKELSQLPMGKQTDICIRPGTTILGVDDDHLRFASRYHKQVRLKPGDGKKGALHNSFKEESAPEVFSSFLMLSMRTSNARIAPQMLSGFLIAIDRVYATKDIIGAINTGQLSLRFMVTFEKISENPFMLWHERADTIITKSENWYAYICSWL
ncbi:hypothetical protein FGB62_100g318 [Gracilaria domingensis]|nr:hypothetical protein FGB62_100g318 [Gracilaria domingensis]